MHGQRPRGRLFRLTLVFAPAAIVIAVGAAAFAVQREGLRTRDLVLLHTRIVLDASSRLLTALLDAETGIRGYIITRNPALLAPYADARVRADSQLARLRTLTSDNPRQQARVDTLTVRSHE